MKKKILMGTFLLSISLFGVFSLNAATNRVEIVSENDSVKQLSSDGTNILNTINREKSDLVNGNIAIDIIINNSKKAEIFYAIDNTTAMASVKDNLIDSMKTGALSLEGLSNIKQGIVTTKDGNISVVDLDDANIEMQLENVKSNGTDTTSNVFEIIDKAVSSFTKEAQVKVIVVNLASLPSLTRDQVNELTTKINDYSSKGIKFVVYGINLTDKANFDIIFSGAKDSTGQGVYTLTTATLKDMNFLSNVLSYLPNAKKEMNTVITFDNYILNNFIIKDVIADTGSASYSAADNKVTWTMDSVAPNQIVKLTYYLSLKTAVDESLIDNTIMRTNRQIVTTGVSASGEHMTGTYPDNEHIDDQICSPTIKLLKEAIDNPKTGMVDYIIAGSCMLAVALITIVILNRKNEFSRI